MRPRAPLLALAAGAAVLLAGCAAPPADGPDTGRVLSFERLDGCQSRQATALDVVVTDAAEWAALWRRACGGGTPGTMGGASEAPPVDFTRRSVVASFWGEKPTGGFGVSIVRVTDGAQYTWVAAERIQAGPGCAVTQAITYPHAIVVAERATKPGRFEFSQKTVDC